MKNRISFGIFILCFLTFLLFAPVALTDEEANLEDPSLNYTEETQLAETVPNESIEINNDVSSAEEENIEIENADPVEETEFDSDSLNVINSEENAEIESNDKSPSEDSDYSAEVNDSDVENEEVSEAERSDEPYIPDSSEIDSLNQTPDFINELPGTDQPPELLSLPMKASLLQNPATPDYVLLIPQNLDVPYQTTSTQLGTVSIISSSGFFEGKNLSVTVTYDSFSSETTTSVIPYNISLHLKDSASNSISMGNLSSGQQLIFMGSETGSLIAADSNGATNNGGNPYTDFVLYFETSSKNWESVDPGVYSSSIVFSSSIVE